MFWHWQAPFGASGFCIAAGSEPQILDMRQKIKNFLLFAGGTEKGKSVSSQRPDR